MNSWLDVPVRPRDAIRALWAWARGKPYLMRVELIGDMQYWRVR